MRLRFRENGPLVIDVKAGTRYVMNGEERTLERDKMALCRCGRSESKPFCDGSHKRFGFVAEKGVLEVRPDRQDG